MPTPLRALATVLAAILVVAAAAGARDLARPHPRAPLGPAAAGPPTPAPALAVPGWPGPEAREIARAGARVTALAEDGDGARWIGTAGQGVLRVEPGGAAAGVPGLDGRERTVNALALHDGLVWAATQGGLVALDGDRRVLALLAGEEVAALAAAGGALLAATPRGLFRVSAGGGAARLDVAGPSGEPLRPTALAAAAGRLWIGTAAGAYSLPVSLLDPALLTRTARAHPLAGGGACAEACAVSALAPLGSGAVAGTEDGGAVRLREDGGAIAACFGDAGGPVNPGAAGASGDAALIGTEGGGLLVLRAAGPGLAVARLASLGRVSVSAVLVAGERVLVGRSDGAVLEVRWAAPAAIEHTARTSADAAS